MSVKRIVSLIAVLLLLFQLAACKDPTGENAGNSPVPTEALTEKPSAAPKTQAPTPEPTAAPHSGSLNDNSAAHSQEVRYGGIDELKELYELAAEIGSRYGIYIYFADISPYWVYVGGENKVLDDPVLIRSALETVDRILSAYPKGFFDQLVYGDLVCLDLYIVGFNSSGWSGYSTTYRLPDGRHNCVIVCANAQPLIDGLTYVLPHELTHVTDNRIAYVSEHEDGCLFSEERWMALNPEGFEYGGENEEKTLEMYDRFPTYFSDSYGAENPLEDRATLFGSLMRSYFEDRHDASDRLPDNCCEKLGFYLRCIRDAFDTTGWPEKTAWEQTLDIWQGGE